LKVSRLFAQQGATLILTDFNSDFKNVLNEISSVDNNIKKDHLTHACDVRSSKDVNVLFKTIKDKYRTPANIVVNSAGVAKTQKFTDITEEEYDNILNTNLKGSFLVTQAAIRELVNNHKNVKLQTDETYGSIIHLASIIGKLGSNGHSPYAASKSGLEGLTKTLAREYGKYQIRVNAVLPGLIDTPMVAGGSEKQKQGIIAATPLGRIGFKFTYFKYTYKILTKGLIFIR
jgi:NAD(P)-dependent dehydrogenase (short-subunit alcohol dehydrogenase family)